MNALKPPIFQATAADADALAHLINIAGEGLPLYLWERMRKQGETAWDVGRRRAQRAEGAFSYRNAVTLRAGDEPGGAIVACLIGYEMANAPEPVGDDMPAVLVPLQELENLTPGTWYVNVLATFPEYRGEGYGSRLLRFAEARARASHWRGLSLIIDDANAGARRLYERHGFRAIARRSIVKEEWINFGTEWVLFVKQV
jgi:ribosomal protein S18 acetylase RimI-like enzyme